MKEKEGRVGVGIVGLGRSGWNIHANLLETLPDKYRIKAVSDPVPDRMEEAAKKFQCRTCKNIEELISLSEVELVVVATPSHLHAENAIKAMEAGKRVVCEKPMAKTLSEADAMIASARSTGSLLTIFQNRRYAPDFRTVKKVIDSGKLGRIILIRMAWHGFGRRWDWQTLKKFGGGTLNNTCPHAIDQALQLFGPAEPEIYCHLEKTLALGDADDHVKIIMKASGAPMIDIEVTSVCSYPQESWLVMGTGGTLTGNASQLRWKYYHQAELPERKLDSLPTPDRSYNQDEIKWYEEDWSADKDTGGGSENFYLDLYRTIRKKAPLAITPESARRVMWVIERCHQLSPV